MPNPSTLAMEDDPAADHDCKACGGYDGPTHECPRSMVETEPDGPAQAALARLRAAYSRLEQDHLRDLAEENERLLAVTAERDEAREDAVTMLEWCENDFVDLTGSEAAARARGWRK